MSGFFVAVQRLVRRWRCSHEWRFERGIYGDEINHVSLSKIYRSWWKCHLCGKRQLRPGLGAPNTPAGRKTTTTLCTVCKRVRRWPNNPEHAPRNCSALIKECERVVKYLREIGEQSRGESTFPSSEYADAMADSLDYALKQNKEITCE